MAKITDTIPVRNVDEYLGVLPEAVQTTLEKLRKAIKEAAPMAEEVISYQVPTYKYKGPLVHFAAFKDHCSFVVVSQSIGEIFKKELSPYKISGRTIHFSPAKPLPAALVKKIVKIRLDENEARSTAQEPKKPAAKKRDSPKTSDADKVNEYMRTLSHPLKAEIEAVRAIIKNANAKLEERIKWNAPSYHYQNEDLVTFNPRTDKHVHLVFHHPSIVKIKSILLEGDYTDRRMVYFNSMKDVKANKKELERIMKQLIIKLNNK